MKKPQLFTTGRVFSAACLVVAFGAAADDVTLSPTDQGRINLDNGNTRAGSLSDGRTIRTGTNGSDKHFQGFTIFDTSGVFGPISNALFDFEVWQPVSTAPSYNGPGAVQGNPGDLQIWGVSSTAGFDAFANNTELGNMVTDGGSLIQNLGVLAPGAQSLDVSSFVNAERAGGNSTFAFMFKHSNVSLDGAVDFYAIYDSNDPATQRPELSLTTAQPQPSPITFTVSDVTPNGDNGNGTRSLTSTLGSVSATPTLPTTTYTVEVDLTSIGGGTNETIAFDIAYTANGGNPAYNAWGNVAVDGGNVDQIDGLEDLTATVSLNDGLTTYNGDVEIRLAEVAMGGVGGSDAFYYYFDGRPGFSPQFGGTSLPTLDLLDPDLQPETYSTDYVTIDLINTASTVNIQGLTVELTLDPIGPPVPEPTSLALLALGGLFMSRRRRG